MGDNKTTYRLRVRNAAQLVTVCSKGQRFLVGDAMDQIEVIEGGGLIAGHDGNIVAVGKDDELQRQYDDQGATYECEVDASGHAVLPGLVDGHSHPVWSGDRCGEFKQKLAGATYMDIHKQGGGIGYTVKCTRASPEETLLELFLARLGRMLKFGTTLLEAKSGYGLDTENELKMLRVLHQANAQHPVDIVANFCGAHSVPKGMTAAEATRDVIEKQLPAVLASKERGEISPELMDVFCEKGVFETEDSRAILKAGKEAGLSLNFHGDELHPTHSAELGAELGATAISHLEHVSQQGMMDMADKGTVAVLLPTTAYVLRIAPPPARELISRKVPVALGSDYNPNAHCLSMPHVMNLACVNMRMTMNEALVAATINSAASMGREKTHGSLEVGKAADLVQLSVDTWEHLIYEMADPPILAVFKRGARVHHAKKD